MGWVVLWVQSFHFAMGLAGLGQLFGGLGWVEAIGPTDNSGLNPDNIVSNDNNA